MTLADAGIGIMSCPAFVKWPDAVRNPYKQCAIQVVFLAKCLHAMHKVLSATRINSDKCAHLEIMLVSTSLSCPGKLSSMQPTWLTLFRFTDMLAPFSRKRFPKLPLTNLRSKLSRKFSSGIDSTYFLNSFWRVFSSEARFSRPLNIESTSAKGIQRCKPVLFTCRQHAGNQHKLKDFKDEIGFAMLIPRCLQFRIGVRIVPKKTAVLNPTPVQIGCTANVKASGRNATDAINTHRHGDSVRFHIPNSLVVSSLVFLAARRARDPLFSVGSYSTDRQHLDCTFFSTACKAEAKE